MLFKKIKNIFQIHFKLRTEKFVFKCNIAYLSLFKCMFLNTLKEKKTSFLSSAGYLLKTVLNKASKVNHISL